VSLKWPSCKKQLQLFFLLGCETEPNKPPLEFEIFTTLLFKILPQIGLTFGHVMMRYPVVSGGGMLGI
jgi:hypothetical protein